MPKKKVFMGDRLWCPIKSALKLLLCILLGGSVTSGSSDCTSPSGVVIFSSAWLSLYLSLHGNTESLGAKKVLGVSVNSKLPITSF